MKTLFKTVLVIVGLIIYSCNDKKVQNKEIISNSFDTLESPPSKPEYLNDKKKYVLPSITNINVEDINPVFLELLRDKKILKTEKLDKINLLLMDLQETLTIYTTRGNFL